MRAVYARRKGPVKRKGVISRGCEANCALLFWTKRFKYKLTRLVTTSYTKSAEIAAGIALKVQIHALRAGTRLRRRRNPVNPHVRAQNFGDQDRAICLLIILHDSDPSAADGEARAVERVNKVALATALWLIAYAGAP